MDCESCAIPDQAVVDKKETELKTVNMEKRGFLKFTNNLVTSHGIKVTEVVTDASPQITLRKSKWIFSSTCSQMFMVVCISICRMQLYAFLFHCSHKVYIMVILSIQKISVTIHIMCMTK